MYWMYSLLLFLWGGILDAGLDTIYYYLDGPMLNKKKASKIKARWEWRWFASFMTHLDVRFNTTVALYFLLLNFCRVIVTGHVCLIGYESITVDGRNPAPVDR